MNTPNPRVLIPLAVLIVGLLILLSLSGCGDSVVTPLDERRGEPPTGADIVTLQVGNEWTYRRTDRNGGLQAGDTTTRIVSVDSTSTEVFLYQFEHFQRGDGGELVPVYQGYERFFKDGVVYHMGSRWNARPVAEILNPNQYAVGDTIQTEEYDPFILGSMTLEAKNQTITTPAGAFEGCYTVALGTVSRDLISYKPGVGHIRTLSYYIEWDYEAGAADSLLMEINELIDYRIMPLALP